MEREEEPLSNHDDDNSRRRSPRLVRSESRKIHRCPSTDYTPPAVSMRKTFSRRTNSYSNRSSDDHSVVHYMTVSEEPQDKDSSNRVLQHASSAPASGFRQYFGKKLRRKKKLNDKNASFIRPHGMPSLSEMLQPEEEEGEPNLSSWDDDDDDDSGEDTRLVEPLMSKSDKQQHLDEESLLLQDDFPTTEESYLLQHHRSTDARTNNGMDNSQRKQEKQQQQSRRRLYQIALCYLQDFEASRPPTLPPDSDHVTNQHLCLHGWRFSKLWNLILASAMASLFAASGFELKQHHGGLLLSFTFFAVTVFVADMIMMKMLFGDKQEENKATESLSSPVLRFTGDGGTIQAHVAPPTQTCAPAATITTKKTRKSRSRWWALPLSLFLVLQSVETLLVVGRYHNSKIIWMSAWKPVVLFYTSPKARNALDAMNRVARIVFKVLFMELFLIYTFGSVACQLYGMEFATNFGGLAVSFLSMYEISTLVATPGLWMPIVHEHPTSSPIFFIVFLVICVFYLHSLVLSVVFQSYMEGLLIIRDHAASDKEETLRLAFQTLYRSSTLTVDRCAAVEQQKEDEVVVIPTKTVEKVFRIMKPDYGREKINALVNIIDPSQVGYVDYSSFRTTMPKAMITSVRTARPHNKLSLAIEVFESFLAMANLVYVVLTSSTVEPTWWIKLEVPIGGLITIVCIADLLFRLAYSQTQIIPEAWALDATFDGLCTLAVLVSCVGLVLHRFDLTTRALDWLVTGRAIDMIRVLRLAREARGIVRRSGELLPYVVGPVVLVITALHMFTYLCMAIWGGVVVVGENNNDIPPYYDLNNFNSYTSGLMTMFNMLVANDWHLISKVFIVPSHPKTNKLVYPFFIFVNLIIVSILLNVLTAFFVGAFVTRTSWKRRTSEGRHHVSKRKSSGTANSSVIPLRPIQTRRRRTVSLISSDGLDDGDSTDSSNNSITMSQRQDFDDVLKATMGKGDNEDDDAAQYCCHLLDLFETLAAGPAEGQQIGYLVSCQQSMSRYGNQRFKELVHQYMDDEALHAVIDEMTQELAGSPNGHEVSVHRAFQVPGDEPGSKDELELTASILKEGSSVALFLAKIKFRT